MNPRKVIIPSLVGSIGLSVLGLSLSFAWYNTSENLYVDTLVITLSGRHELLISTSGEMNTFTDAVKYHYDEKDNDLVAAGLFQPVSSMFKSDWLENDLKKEPELHIYTSAAVNERTFEPIYESATWGYYSQHLYLYSSSDIYATVDASSFSAVEILRRNEIYARELMTQHNVQEEYATYHPEYTQDDIFNDIVTKLNTLKKCLRVGLYDIEANEFSIIEPFKDEDTVLGGRADLFANKYYDSFKATAIGSDHYGGDPYHYGDFYEIVYGEVNDYGLAKYDEAVAADTDAPEKYTSFASRTKEGTHPFNLEASLANGLVINKENSYSLDPERDDYVENNLNIKLKGGTPKEFVLMIYMEGWDKDCTNMHMGGAFSIDMEFKISETKQ